MIEINGNYTIYKNTEGKTIGRVEVIQENNTITIIHTYVDSAYRGQKIAAKLVKATVDYYNQQGMNIIYSCSYAKKWKENNN